MICVSDLNDDNKCMYMYVSGVELRLLRRVSTYYDWRNARLQMSLDFPLAQHSSDNGLSSSSPSSHLLCPPGAMHARAAWFTGRVSWLGAPGAAPSPLLASSFWLRLATKLRQLWLRHQHRRQRGSLWRLRRRRRRCRASRAQDFF